MYLLTSMIAFASVKHGLKPTDITSFEIPSYYLINKPRLNINKRAKRGSGGVILFIHDSLKPYVEL